MAWDARICGRYRPAEHAFWLGEGAIPLWFRRDGARAGYGYIQTRRGTITFPEAMMIGPVGAETPADALACVCAAVEYARRLAPMLLLDLPGPHPALRPLLEVGFRIVDTETFMSTEAERFVDPECYVGSPDAF